MIRNASIYFEKSNVYFYKIEQVNITILFDSLANHEIDVYELNHNKYTYIDTVKQNSEFRGIHSGKAKLILRIISYNMSPFRFSVLYEAHKCDELIISTKEKEEININFPNKSKGYNFCFVHYLQVGGNVNINYSGYNSVKIDYYSTRSKVTNSYNHDFFGSYFIIATLSDNENKFYLKTSPNATTTNIQFSVRFPVLKNTVFISDKSYISKNSNKSSNNVLNDIENEFQRLVNNGFYMPYNTIGDFTRSGVSNFESKNNHTPKTFLPAEATDRNSVSNNSIKKESYNQCSFYTNIQNQPSPKSESIQSILNSKSPQFHTSNFQQILFSKTIATNVPTEHKAQTNKSNSNQNYSRGNRKKNNKKQLIGTLAVVGWKSSVHTLDVKKSITPDIFDLFDDFVVENPLELLKSSINIPTETKQSFLLTQKLTKTHQYIFLPCSGKNQSSDSGATFMVNHTTVISQIPDSFVDYDSELHKEIIKLIIAKNDIATTNKKHVAISIVIVLFSIIIIITFTCIVCNSLEIKNEEQVDIEDNFYDADDIFGVDDAIPKFELFDE